MQSQPAGLERAVRVQPLRCARVGGKGGGDPLGLAGQAGECARSWPRVPLRSSGQPPPRLCSLAEIRQGPRLLSASGRRQSERGRGARPLRVDVGRGPECCGGGADWEGLGKRSWLERALLPVPAVPSCPLRVGPQGAPGP